MELLFLPVPIRFTTWMIDTTSEMIYSNLPPTPQTFDRRCVRASLRSGQDSTADVPTHLAVRSDKNAVAVRCYACCCMDNRYSS